MAIALAVAVLVLAGLLVVQQVLHAREKREMRSEFRLERVGLLNRIQRPETLPVEDMPEPSGELLHVPYDDDAAHDDYMRDRAAGQVR